MPHERPVRACLCYPHAFSEIKALSQTHGWTRIGQITAALGCGSGCGLCLPYLARMLQTGETAFDVISPNYDETASPSDPENRVRGE